MTAARIKEIINDSLKSEPDMKNVDGLDLTECLIEPLKQKYKDSNDATEVYELWTVFEEKKDGSGYKIYYDEESGLFGLAVQSDGEELIAIAEYGDFLNTVYAL